MYIQRFAHVSSRIGIYSKHMHLGNICIIYIYVYTYAETNIHYRAVGALAMFASTHAYCCYPQDSITVPTQPCKTLDKNVTSVSEVRISTRCPLGIAYN